MFCVDVSKFEIQTGTRILFRRSLRYNQPVSGKNQNFKLYFKNPKLKFVIMSNKFIGNFGSLGNSATTFTISVGTL